MERESPVMKAWREFALADPEDCEKEWDAYLALVNRKETASGSSPTNSASSLHHRAPATAVTAPSTSRSSAPLSALSGVTSGSHDDLSPEARRMYDYIVGNSDEFASRDGLSPGVRRHYDYLVGSSSSPTPAAFSRAQSSASTTSGIPRVAAAATALAEEDLHSVTPSTCSTVFLRDDRTSSPTSEAEAIYQLLIADRNVYDIQFAEYAEKYRASSCRSGDLRARAPSPVAAQAAAAGHSTSAVSSTVSTEGVLSALSSTTVSTTTATHESTLDSAPPIMYSMVCPGGDVSAGSPTSTSAVALEDVSHTAPTPMEVLAKQPVQTPAACLTDSLDDGTVARVMLGDTQPFSVSPTMSVFVCPDAQLNAAPKPLEEIPRHVDVDHVALLQLDREQLVTSTASALGLEPMFSGVLNNYIALSNGAVASVEGKDTEGDVVEPVIYNSNWVDLIIVTVPPEMTLGAASTVVRLLGIVRVTDVTSENGSSGSLELVFCVPTKLFTWSPQFKWPSMSLNGPFLIARNIQQDFTEIYSLTAMVSRLLTQVVRWDAAMHQPFFRSSTGKTILLPWDPGLSLQVAPIHNQISSSIILTWLCGAPNLSILMLSELHWQYSSCRQNLPESFPWYIAWLLVGSYSADADMCITIQLSRGSSGKFSVGLTFTCTSYACVREFHQGSSSAQKGQMIFTKVTTAVHIITYQHLLLVKTHGFYVRLTPSASLELSVGKLIPNIEVPWKCVIFVQPKPPWSYLAPTNSIGVAKALHTIIVSFEFNQFGICASHGSRKYGSLEFERKMMGLQFIWLLGLYSSWTSTLLRDGANFGSQLFEWKIPWCPRHTLSSSSSLWINETGGHWTLKFAFFNWGVGNIVDAVTTIKYVSGMIAHALQYVETGRYFTVVKLLMRSRLSQAWVLYLPVACIIHWGSKMMSWEIASSSDGILTCTKQVLVSWDPGGVNPVLAPGLKFTQLQFSYQAWDPGRMQRRLEGKPNLKKGGLSATIPSTAGLDRGPPLLGHGLLRNLKRSTIKRREVATRKAAWNGTDWTAASAEAWLGACVLVPLLPPRSPPSSSNITLEFELVIRTSRN